MTPGIIFELERSIYFLKDYMIAVNLQFIILCTNILSNFLYRIVLITSILLHSIHFPFVSSRISLTGLKDKAVSSNFVIKSLNMSGKTFSFCLARCLEDCLCKSFQVCDSSKCEISSINKNDHQSAFETRPGCVYYDLDAIDVSMTK